MIWEPNAIHKVDLNVLDIGWTIIQKVDTQPETCDYLVLGVLFSFILMLVPVGYRLYHSKDQLEAVEYYNITQLCMVAQLAFGHNWGFVNIHLAHALILKFYLVYCALIFIGRPPVRVVNLLLDDMFVSETMLLI